jgi:hypothetical protein
MKDKIIKGIAVATVGIISAALVAYLKDPENRYAVKAYAKKQQKYAKKQIKLLKSKYAKE